MTLSNLNINQSCVIKKINLPDDLYQTFQNLGIVPGVKVKCVLISPFNDPKAFKINGMTLAIRNQDSSLIEVEEIE